uniref:RRM domain-containing protein n=1 Tax=Oryza punctata TaxID=4537 RepID=A0A0E0K5E6_ORYPU
MAAASSSTSSAAGSPAPAHAPAVGGAAGGGGGGGGGGVPNHRTRFGDTTLTKVFVGGLAWETPSKGLQEHFQQYGEILEAVVITDRETGRSKGYGFVTFRDPESAREAVRNPNPTIGGRRANCNIASMGPPRPSPSRGRAPRGSHFPDQPHMSPQPYMGGRLPPQQMTAPPQPMYYHPQFGYWYPQEYPYQQASIPITLFNAVYNSQALQHYYPQLYGPTSPSTPSYQFMGYMTGGLGPRAGFSPMQQQAARPHFIQQPAAQLEGGSFPPGPSLPPDFRLQLPPHALSRQPDDTTGAQSAPPVSATAEATPTTDSKEASKTVGSNSDLNTSN